MNEKVFILSEIVILEHQNCVNYVDTFKTHNLVVYFVTYRQGLCKPSHTYNSNTSTGRMIK